MNSHAPPKGADTGGQMGWEIDLRSSAFDILSLDVWQNCAFSGLLGYREVCALACCSKGLCALMANEQIWHELFGASKRLPALSSVTNWRETFKQRTLVGARWRVDTMVRSKASWKWFIARCMKSSVPYRVGLDFRTLRVCPSFVTDWHAARGQRGGCLRVCGGSVAGVQCLAPPRASAAAQRAECVSFAAQRAECVSLSELPDMQLRAVWLAPSTAVQEEAGSGDANCYDGGDAGPAIRFTTAEWESRHSVGEFPCACGCVSGFESSEAVYVDAQGQRVFALIQEAIKFAAPLDRIVIEPGEYRENLVVDKPLELIGAESRKQVVIRGSCTSATFWLTASCRLSHLTLTQDAATADSPILATILASDGLHIMIDECDISSAAGHSVVVKGPRTQATISHNQIHDSRGVGVLYCDDSTGTLADNIAGIAVCSGAAPHLLHNRVGRGEGRSLCVAEGCHPLIEHNVLEAEPNLSALSVPMHLRASLMSRNTLADSPVLDPGHLATLETLGSRWSTSSAEDGVFRASFVERASRKTASMLSSASQALKHSHDRHRSAS
ncbi:pectin lyase fold/virulence factor [Pavlovales sp. CCMP2436]|nr:pectin lyase fold/virulence factor [Pavlovales sp. CCMP2436]